MPRGTARRRPETAPEPLTNALTGRPDGRCKDWRPVDRYVAEFAQELLGMKLSERTVHEYARDVEIFGSYLQGRPITDKAGEPYRGPFGDLFAKANISSVRRFVMHLGSLKYREAPIRRKLAVLRRFFKFLKREGYRKDNPALDVPNIRLPKRLPKALPVRDIMQLIGTRPAAGQPELRWRRDLAILELLYASGMRRAELVGINVSDVDFADKNIRVIGKGNKQRVVFFNNATEAALQAYLRVRPRCPDGALFVSRLGRRLSYSQVGHVFAAYVALSGLEGKITPHTMRHSVATHLHKSGVDLMTIKEFLGHESIQTTQIYAEMTLDHVRKSYDKHHPRDKQD